ncbi:glutamine synthetase-like [Siniperca chuatsi]|uniref:glutamine synthetase-like n=1 Tax=Siniperca chuatsi TaxID=119488 RepID=UPI001CE0976B|nr:glutamine synthetase-like [Siniperca chuatsi]XP_044047059.1 glutamine synthetase-like [Siniperca chuatsi]XP_044047060.1 glutamine synthetase-like [Siniperca chuatsi]
MSVLSESISLHKTVKKYYLSLDKGAECQVTYIWIDETGENLRCKTRTLNKEPTGIRDIPEWSTCWVDGNLIEVTLVPVRMFRDPFTLDPNKLVLCEVLDSNCVPIGSNQRSQCAKVMEEVKDFQPWFGMEQEYTLFSLDGRPFGWPPQGCPFTGAHCAVGIDKVYGRDICICHYKACLYAGVKICGTNAESSQLAVGDRHSFWGESKWEFQVGLCEGIEMGDHLWMARYILHRVCEDFGVVASLDAKPIKGNIGTSGCHTNFSTKEMRSEGGLQFIEEAIRRLSKRHSQHLRVYDPHDGANNMSSFHDFSTATAHRNVSVHIPGHVCRMGCGYLEDRCPAANCNPYNVMRALVETCLLETAGEDDNERETMAS